MTHGVPLVHPQAGTNAHALERLLLALDTARGFDDVDDGLLWAALHAAGVTPAWRDAVRAAGGPAAVLSRGVLPAFALPWRRRRLLDLAGIAQRVQRLLPFLSGGGRVVGDDAELARCHDEPVLCFYGAGRGRLPPPGTPTVAIVGSREASVRHIERTAVLAGALAAAGVVVVSGGARGVDRAAQRAARLARGPVVVVAGELPTKVPDDVTADPELCWVSPHAPWEHAAKHHFVARNTWIAALADVVVVVCGGETSGTQHTVEAAVRLGRPVATLSVDDVHDPLAAVPRALLEDGVGHEIADDVDVDALVRLQPRPGAREAWTAHFARKKGRVVRRRDVPLRLPLVNVDGTGVPVAGSGDASVVDDGAPPLLRLLRRHGGELLIDEAAARLHTSMRELLVDAAALEMNGTLRREGALLCLVD